MIGEMIGSAAGGWLGGPPGAAIGSVVGGAVDHAFEKVLHKLEDEKVGSDNKDGVGGNNVQRKEDTPGTNVESYLNNLPGEHVFISLPAIVTPAHPT
ncbi:hypothetical protein FBZ93_11145 [Bradyrhizobium macuxiense]|uniref:Glycine zipper domain-containing protein n=1 Tax=Bradyrhizobium macuxiense TaxID=1755647 RepID=A0A560LBQ0_9BRAD|nr:hypothetical protein [Bradyrhizobium macuxiense]TWB93006.1 hypothetical protein FBZ93_11145 [Bradyrhizobium macuxiense]